MKMTHFIASLLHPVMYLGVKLIKPMKIHIIQGSIQNNCIYVVNHSNGKDFPTAAQIVKHHFFILADYTMQNDIVVDILNRLSDIDCDSLIAIKRKGYGEKHEYWDRC